MNDKGLLQSGHSKVLVDECLSNEACVSNLGLPSSLESDTEGVVSSKRLGFHVLNPDTRYSGEYHLLNPYCCILTDGH